MATTSLQLILPRPCSNRKGSFPLTSSSFGCSFLGWRNSGHTWSTQNSILRWTTKLLCGVYLTCANWAQDTSCQGYPECHCWDPVTYVWQWHPYSSFSGSAQASYVIWRYWHSTEIHPVLSALTDELSSEENVSRYCLSVLHCIACYGGHPEVVVPKLFYFFHASPLDGSLIISKTQCNIYQSFIWKGMDSGISTYYGL